LIKDMSNTELTRGISSEYKAIVPIEEKRVQEAPKCRQRRSRLHPIP
jgi:hypothetical protein